MSTSESSPAVGEIVVYQPVGLVRMRGTRPLRRQGTGLMLATLNGDVTFVVHPERVRKPMGRAEAERVLAILRDRSCAPDGRRHAYRIRDLVKATAEGSADEQVRVLQLWYRGPYRVARGRRGGLVGRRSGAGRRP